MVQATLPDTYPVPREDPLAPASAYQRIRTEEPIRKMRLSVDGSTAWIVTRHEDARAVLRDPRFSSNHSRQGYPGRVVVRPPGPGVLTMTDPPDHSRVRKVLAHELRPNRVQALVPAIERAADSLLTRMASGAQPADLVDRYALPFALHSLCALLGAAPEDMGVFRRVTAVMDDRSTPAEVRQQARDGLVEFLKSLAREKEQNPGEDLMSRLVHEHESAGSLTREETIGLVTLLSLVGFESVANQIALAVVTLHEYPQWRGSVAQGGGELHRFVEELLRHQTVIDLGVRRVALEDLTIGGQLIREGEGVIVYLAAANRDPKVYPNAERFDVSRGGEGHLSFGYGIHQCTAAMLALTELRIGISRLLERLPELRLAVPIEQLRFRQNMFVHGVHELPVAW
jgi:cytochrome P450